LLLLRMKHLHLLLDSCSSVSIVSTVRELEQVLDDIDRLRGGVVGMLERWSENGAEAVRVGALAGDGGHVEEEGGFEGLDKSVDLLRKDATIAQTYAREESQHCRRGEPKQKSAPRTAV
jgi:hypothetical protein